MPFAAVVGRLVANACVPSAAFQVLTERMNSVAVVEAELMNGSSHVPMVRTTLRQLLLEGLVMSFSSRESSFASNERQRER